MKGPARWRVRAGDGCPRTAVRGFTLVEVVVALTILSLLLLATITGMRTLANTQSALDRTTGRVDELRAVSSFLRDAMESAVVGEAGAGGLQLGGMTENSGYFELGPQSLAWRSSVQFGESFGGAYLLRIAREGDALVLRWQRGDSAGRPEDWAGAPALTVAEQVEAFEVAWRVEWGEAWRQDRERDEVPGWVRLQVKASGRYWPDIVMQVPR